MQTLRIFSFSFQEIGVLLLLGALSELLILTRVGWLMQHDLYYHKVAQNDDHVASTVIWSKLVII